MSLRMLSPTEAAELAALDLTYDDVGGTVGDLPLGYHHQDHRAVLGRGEKRFAVARDRLLTWGMHRRSGFTVAASADRVAPGVDVALRLGPAFVGLGGACRVLRIEESPIHVAWAYGTLPGHAESGEESFEVRLAPDGRVWFRARSFSRPASRLFRTLGPLGRVGQAASLRLYGAALR